MVAEQNIREARALGARDASILGRHVLPNTLAPIVVNAIARWDGEGWDDLDGGINSPIVTTASALASANWPALPDTPPSMAAAVTPERPAGTTICTMVCQRVAPSAREASR